MVGSSFLEPRASKSPNRVPGAIVYDCQPFGLIKTALVKSRESSNRIYKSETEARNSTPTASLVTVPFAGQ